MFARTISSVEIIKPRWRSYTRTSREDRWNRNKGRKVKQVQSLTKWLTVVTNEKLREWKSSLSILEYSSRMLTNRGLWIAVHHSAKRKKTSIICVANLPSLPWKITSMVHKIRTTLKRRWIFKRASGNRCLHDAGKTRPRRKSSSGGSSIPMSIHPRTKSNYRKGKNPSRRQIRTTIPGWQTCRNIPSRFSSSSMSTSTPWLTSQWRSESNDLRCYTSSIEKGRVYKIPKLIGKRINVWGLAALPSPQKLQICNLVDIRAILRTQRFLTGVQFIYTVDRARDHYSIL